MPWTVEKDGSRGDVGFQVAAQGLVRSVGRIDFSVAEHRRQLKSQLPGKNTKDGLAFRALLEMDFLPIQKLKILTCRLGLRLIEQPERLDMDGLLHCANVSIAKTSVGLSLTQLSRFVL